MTDDEIEKEALHLEAIHPKETGLRAGRTAAILRELQAERGRLEFIMALLGGSQFSTREQIDLAIQATTPEEWPMEPEVRPESLVVELPFGSHKFDKEAYDFDESAENAARRRGMIVVYPGPNEIQLDLDSEEAYVEFKRRFGELVKPFGIRYEMSESFSHSGPPHRHIYITFPERSEPFTEAERLSLQWALGSDPMREFLNTMRVFQGDKVIRPNRLFEKPRP